MQVSTLQVCPAQVYPGQVEVYQISLMQVEPPMLIFLLPSTDRLGSSVHDLYVFFIRHDKFLYTQPIMKLSATAWPSIPRPSLLASKIASDSRRDGQSHSLARASESGNTSYTSLACSFSRRVCACIAVAGTHSPWPLPAGHLAMSAVTSRLSLVPFHSPGAASASAGRRLSTLLQLIAPQRSSRYAKWGLSTIVWMTLRSSLTL